MCCMIFSTRQKEQFEMPRGGYRPGAGRPKGSKSERHQIPMLPEQAATSRTPLEYMLAVMNDSAADPARRDKMAIAAAPFMHARIADNRYGKRDEERDRAAETAK